MWIKTPGEIDSRLLLLGVPQSTMYLVKGERYMLIGGGGQWCVSALEEQFKQYRIDVERIQYLFIGHTHYDHCGTVPYLLKRYPHLQILASVEAQKIFSMEKALQNMRKFSLQVMNDLGLPAEVNGVPLEFDRIPVNRPLAEGDRIDLGDGISFRVFLTPGHSRCSAILYEPENKWLFTSDSLGIPVESGNGFVITASESFIAYLDSIKKLKSLDVRLCAWEHYGSMTEGDAAGIVERIVRHTIDYHHLLVEIVKQTGDVEKTIAWAASDFLDRTKFDFVPPNVVHHIWRGIVTNALQEKPEVSDYL